MLVYFSDKIAEQYSTEVKYWSIPMWKLKLDDGRYKDIYVKKGRTACIKALADMSNLGDLTERVEKFLKDYDNHNT